MRIVIAGAHGQIGLRLSRILAGRGDEVAGLIRNPDHASDLAAAGAQPVVCDLERASIDAVGQAVGAADAVVFAAGAGAGSGAERKLTMDRDGAIKLLEATGQTHPRYVMVSAVGAQSPPPGEGVFEVYLRAKAEADAAVMASDREWVIVRPGRLTDDPGTGTARIETEPFRGEISRDDVAAVLAAVLNDERAPGHVLYVNQGEVAIGDALAKVLAD
jgi:uncharacterized protein YbjT (DUF2867 family)